VAYTADVFQQLNGREPTVEEVDAAEIIQSAAAGKLTVTGSVDEQALGWHLTNTIR
jgi:hypothetical protein